jgi:hypothetical protein
MTFVPQSKTDCLKCFYQIDSNTLASNEKHILKNVNSFCNTKFASYLGICDGQNSNLYLNAVHFLNTSDN